MVNWTQARERIAGEDSVEFFYKGRHYLLHKEDGVFKLRLAQTGRLLYADKSLAEMNRMFYKVVWA